MKIGKIEIRCQNCFNQNVIEVTEVVEKNSFHCVVCNHPVAGNKAILRKADEIIKRELKRIRDSYSSRGTSKTAIQTSSSISKEF